MKNILLGILFTGILCSFIAGAQETSPAAGVVGTEDDNLFEMSLEDLMNVEISSVASLTGTSMRLQPSAVTTISEEQIRQSGARSIMELLDIYVPNLQWIRNRWEPDNLGLRGIMSDRDDKYLLLVNGKVMNERTHYGVVTEKDMVMLGEIHHIDVIRGPGSALYGPGAVSMVINIVTHSAETFEGTEVSSRAGVGEEFYTLEVKHGEKFEDDDGGWFVFAGIGQYPGANEHNSPIVLAGDLPAHSQYSWWDPAWGPHPDPGPFPGEGYRAGDNLVTASVPNDGEAHRKERPIKVHLEVTKGNWDFWARFTRGGKQFMWDKQYYTHDPLGWADWNTKVWDGTRWLGLNPNSYGYKQITGYIGYKEDISDKTSVEYAGSYQLTDYVRYLNNAVSDAYREDEYYLKAMLRHNFNDHHKAAVGFEMSHRELGFGSIGWPNQGFTNSTLNNANGGAGVKTSRWGTTLYSALGEYQWNINEQWTTFLGGRYDDHTYSNPMLSPRASLVYTPNEKDVWKFMWSRSVRSNFEEDMRVGALLGQDEGDPEELESFELRYERQHSKSLDFAVSCYVHWLNLITFSGTAGAPVPVGTQRDWGIELEANYHTEKTQIGISHSFAKLYDFNLVPGNTTVVSSMGNQYGSDFALWSNHLTKITAHHQIDKQFSIDGSARIYWGFPGMSDYDEYIRSTGNSFTPADWQRSYRGNYYLDLGLQYDHSKDLMFRVDGMNLLGIINKDFNKRNYNGTGEMFRSHSPAVTFSLSYRF